MDKKVQVHIVYTIGVNVNKSARSSGVIQFYNNQDLWYRDITLDTALHFIHDVCIMSEIFKMKINSITID